MTYIREIPSSTPWGHPDRRDSIAPGIVRYSTPSHGGIWLAPERVAALPPALQEIATFVERSMSSGSFERQGGRWYEEDCDWSIVAVAFPQHFDPEMVHEAWATLFHWHRAAFDRHFNLPEAT